MSSVALPKVLFAASQPQIKLNHANCEVKNEDYNFKKINYAYLQYILQIGKKKQNKKNTNSMNLYTAPMALRQE